MRIGIIAPPWVPVPPPAYGGTEAVVGDLVRGLALDGHEVVLAAHPDSQADELVAPLTLDDIGAINEPTSLLAHVAAAQVRLTRMGLDVIHDHTAAGALLVRPRRSPPFVVTHHGPFDSTNRLLLRHVARRASVVAISHAHAASAGDVPIAAVVHHGIDTAAYELGDGRGGYAVFLGRMNPDKGPDRAIRIARAAGVPIRLAAKMREPAEREYFEAVVRPMLGPDAEFVGEVGREEKAVLLQGAVALVNPIGWPEPFGMVMIEAMACGTPVVTMRLGAAPELVVHGTTGFVVDDDEDAAQALLLAGTLRRDACRDHVATSFSVPRMVQGYVRAYGRAASTGLDAHAGGQAAHVDEIAAERDDVDAVAAHWDAAPAHLPPAHR